MSIFDANAPEDGRMSASVLERKSMCHTIPSTKYTTQLGALVRLLKSNIKENIFTAD